MRQILCLSADPWRTIPTRTQQLMTRMRDAQVLLFEPPGKYSRQPGRRVRPGLTVCALPPVLEAEERPYRKILVCRPNAQFDADIGFLPGSEQEKISPLMRPIVDNLEILLDLAGKKKERRSEEELRGRIDYFFDTGVITAEAMNFIRGRSITDTWLVIDEAQNLTPRQVKGIITRVGKGTKVVLLGDPAQIDHPLLDTRSNGLTYASARMRGSPLCAQLTMLPDECERSPLALDAAVRM